MRRLSIAAAIGFSLLFAVLPEASCGAPAEPEERLPAPEESPAASRPNPNGPYFEGPIYWGFSDRSADAAKIEDKLVSIIDAEAETARAAGLTPLDKDWPAAAIYVAAYSFTSKKLADALIRAAKSGCEVMVVMDKKQSQGKGGLASSLASNGVVMYLDASHNAMHSKYIICLSQDAVYTGSYNFTENAKKNAENIVGLVGNPFLVMMYLRDFVGHVGHAEQLHIRTALLGRRKAFLPAPQGLRQDLRAVLAPQDFFPG